MSFSKKLGYKYLDEVPFFNTVGAKFFVILNALNQWSYTSNDCGSSLCNNYKFRSAASKFGSAVLLNYVCNLPFNIEKVHPGSSSSLKQCMCLEAEGLGPPSS